MRRVDSIALRIDTDGYESDVFGFVFEQVVRFSELDGALCVYGVPDRKPRN